MAHFHIQNLSFSYPTGGDTVLDNVDLTIEKGEYVVLCGRSGSGKTTLLRHLKSVLAPHGTRSGRVCFNGVPLEEISHRERASEYLMMGLRTVHGIDPEEYESRYRLPFRPLEQLLMRCKREGLAAQSYEGRWHLTPTGFLVSNSIISDLLLRQERSRPIK